MSSIIFDVLISSYPPLGGRYCSASSTPTTATTIHSQGPLNIRFTGFSRTWLYYREGRRSARALEWNCTTVHDRPQRPFSQAGPSPRAGVQE